LGACASNVPKYIGIDLNTNLEKPYDDMMKFIKNETDSKTEIELHFKDSVNFKYDTIQYDMVFTSPPYYNIEKYGDHNPNKTTHYTNTEDWNTEFYNPLFENTYKGLSKGGYYCLNIPIKIYEKVCRPLLGESMDAIPLRIRGRNDMEYKEFIYVWRKSEDRGKMKNNVNK
jgi:hypothetical protein